MAMQTGLHGQVILTVNAGSSSIKFSLFLVPQLNQIIAGQIDGIGGEVRFKVKLASKNSEETISWPNASRPQNHREALSFLIDWLQEFAKDIEVVAVGHRVVHGGQKYTAPTLISNEVMEELDALMILAPLHEPHNLAGIRAAQESFGGIPQIACFDTAFHRTHSFVDDCYAIPRYFYKKGVCRYGFHGLSYEYIADRLIHLFPKEARKKVIIAHLGNGASMTALHHGDSVASTMGFSSLDGLPMGTRCGEIDPGVLLYMMQHEGMDATEIARVLYQESGLKGLSGGLSNDMRTLENCDLPEAKEAIDYYVKEVKREIGALTALMAGLDVVVFTGGIGENSTVIRGRVLREMAWIGIDLDEAKNLDGEVIISSDCSRVLCLKIHTDEERVIARHTLELSNNTVVKNKVSNV
jgi:acetate kinase